MKARVLALVLTLGMFGLPAVPAALAVERDAGPAVEAIIVVAESDLAALLESGLIGEYAFVSADDVGLDPAALVSAIRFGEDTVLTPQELGLDTPDQLFFGGGFAPFFAGFRTISVPIVVPRVVSVPVSVPVVAFRPVFFRPVFAPPPFFPPRPFTIRFVGRIIVLPGF